jgi:hypothetical protein
MTSRTRMSGRLQPSSDWGRYKVLGDVCDEATGPSNVDRSTNGVQS